MPRIACCVPFCRRTYRNDERFIEWICQQHWKTTSLSWRRRHTRFMRAGRRDLANTMWLRLKAQAIERAAGIG